MKKVTREITVDLSRRSNTRVVFATQNDLNSRCLHITLTDDGKPYVVPQNTTVTVNFKRCDETKGAFLAEVLEDGTIKYTINRKIIGIVGQAQCTITLDSESLQRLTSAPFIIDVADTLYFGDGEDATETATLRDELLKAYTSMQRSEVDRMMRETSRDNAEKSRADAEVQRAEAEQIRNEAESQRHAEELFRNKTEGLRRQGEAARVSAEEKRAADMSLKLDEMSESIRLSEQSTQRSNAIALTLESKLANGEFTGERGERGYSGLVPKQDSPYHPSVSVPANLLVNFAELEGDISLSLGAGVDGYDNEWIFTITQGGIAYNVTLPDIEWTLGIAPVFAANTTTELRLHYKGATLQGVWC